MDKRNYATMALMAGLGILAAGVIVIASRNRTSPPPSSPFQAVRQAADLIRLRMEGKDSQANRRALKTAAADQPESPLTRALIEFADGRLEAAASEKPDSPFAHGLRGWILIELGRKTEAAEALNAALKDVPEDWEFRPLFEEALAGTR